MPFALHPSLFTLKEFLPVEAASITVGIDIGGTFTDFVLWSGENNIDTFKLLSTPENPARAVLEGLKICLSGTGISEITIIHGSTVATNALLERKGAKTAIICTEGFTDVIEIGRQNREKLYDLKVKKIPPLVPKELRFGVKERIDYKGNILLSLKKEDLKELYGKLKESDIESLAICLLFSYVNPVHEKIIEEEFKTLGIPLSISYKILPEYREFERVATVVANAFISPKMDNYLKELTQKDRENYYPWKLRILQSNGGTIDSILAREEPVRTVLSGPAGGVVAGRHLASLAGYDNIITLDMGGTSTDVSLSEGEINLTVEGQVGGYPIRVPLIDIHTVGAGGGSIAFIDKGGMLRVGPKSAGSSPGPVCFGRGGKEPTVTDAQFMLARIDNEHFWDGKLGLDKVKTEKIFEEMSEKLNITSLELAYAILKIANSSMEKALKVISLERGYDPRDFILLCFGGAGPLHACDLARELSIPVVMVPKDAGTLSAFGMVVADVIRDFSRTLALKVSEENIRDIEKAFSSLEEKAAEFFPEEDVIDWKTFRFADLRYIGQSYELTVPYDNEFMDNFHELHLQRYHHNYLEKDIELVNIRIKVTGRKKKPELCPGKINDVNSEKAIRKKRKVFWDGEYIDSYIYIRDLLLPGMKLIGPAIVYGKTSTLAIPPGFSGEVDGFENIILEKERNSLC